MKIEDIKLINHSSTQVEIQFIFSDGIPSQLSLWLSTEDSVNGTINQILEFVKKIISRI